MDKTPRIVARSEAKGLSCKELLRGGIIYVSTRQNYQKVGFVPCGRFPKMFFYQQSRKPRVLPVDECFSEAQILRRGQLNSFAVKLAEKIPRASPVELHKGAYVDQIVMFLEL